MKKKDGLVSNKQIVKRFPDLTKETFLLGMGKWLDDKGMKPAKKLKALEAMDIWWVQKVENYQNSKSWFGRKKILKG